MLYSLYFVQTVPLLWVRSKLIPCGGRQRFAWNGYSAETVRVVVGTKLNLVSSVAVVVAVFSSSPVQESQRLF